MDSPNNIEDLGILDVRLEQLSLEQERILLSLARQSILTYLEIGKLVVTRPPNPIYRRKAGVFVTLWHHLSLHQTSDRDPFSFPPRLRGCIGHIEGDKALYRIVSEMAVQAATADHRFAQVTSDEMKQIAIEISILSPLEEIATLDQIEIGVHGLILVSNSRRGLLLPDVATRYDWSPEEFAENLCRKIGLPLDSWREGATLYRFETSSFSELDHLK
jgi:AmmeMemoRadiSam system protein A